MKNKKQNMKQAFSLKETFRRALVVLLTVAMVSSNTPLAYAAEASAQGTVGTGKAATRSDAGMEMEEAPAQVATQPTSNNSAQVDTAQQPEVVEPAKENPAPAEPVSSEPVAEVVDAGVAAAVEEVEVALSFKHAYIHYKGQSVASPTTSIKLSPDEDFEFAATADDGYLLDVVKTTIGGVETEVKPNDKGLYVVPKKDIAQGLALSVLAKGDPFAADNNAPTPIEEKRNEKSEFVYEDADVKVTATLTEPAALPQDVTFKVTPITRDSKDAHGNQAYNYDAYMEALNRSAGNADEFNEQNTLLYDVAFLTPKLDANGKAIAGEFVEVQLSEGQVHLDFQFKKNQLSDGLKADGSSKIEIGHLPLRDSVRSAHETTADASNISANDIIVEQPQDQATNVGAEKVQLSLESLSATSVHKTTGAPALAAQNDAPAAQNGSESSGNPAPAANESTNLRDFLTNAVFNAPQNESGQYVVTPGTSYKFYLTFAERYGNGQTLQFPNGDVAMTYTLPAGLEVADGHEGTFVIKVDDGGTVYSIDGNTYRIDGNTLTVRFNRNHANFNKLAAASDAQFTLSFEGSIAKNADKLLFSDGVERDIEVDTSNSVSVSKTARQSGSSDKMYYEVAVSSQGTSKNVRVHDTIVGDVLTLRTNKFTISSSVAGHDVSTIAPSINGNHFEYLIPEMSDGEVITIKYEAAINPALIAGQNGKYVTKSNNSVEVWSDGDPTHDKKDVETTIDYTPTIKKSDGEVTATDGNKKTVTWTVVANEKCKVSMAGTTITDKISDSSKDFMKFSGDGLHVVVTDADGNEIRTDNVSWNNLQSKTDSEWKYKIPEGDAGKAYKYTIRYTTEVDMTGKTEDVTVKNTTTTDGGKSNSGTGQIGVGEGRVNVSKSATNVDIENREISWKVTFNVPAEGLTYAKIVDTHPTAWFDNANHYEKLLADSVNVTGLLPDESFLVRPDNDTQTSIKFYKAKEQKKANEGLLPTAEGRTVTVEFKTKIDDAWFEASKTTPYLQNHVNNIKLYVNEDSGKPAQATAVVVANSITKTGKYVGSRNVNGVWLPVYRYDIVLSGVDSDDLEVIDEFDTSILSYYNGSEGGVSGWDKEHVFGGGIWSQDNRAEGTFTVMPTGNGIKITTNSSCMPHDTPGEDGETRYYEKYRLTYYLTVKDATALQTIKERAAASADGKYNIHNSASFNGKITGSDVTYQYEGLKKELLTPEDQLKKTDADIWPEFRITLNSGGLALNNGQPLTVTDTVDNLSVDLDSITATPSEGVTWDMTGNTVTYTIPDSTKVVITYKARVIMTTMPGVGETQHITFRNDAKMLGYSDFITETAERKNEGSGTASVPVISLLKYRAGNMTHKLAGAKFQLQDKDGKPILDKNGNKVEFTSDANGKVTIRGDMDQLGWALVKGEKYWLEELEAPSGYMLSGHKYQFTISADGTTDYNQYLYHSGDIMTVKNYPGTDVRVEKEWSDGNERHDSDTVVVKLQQKIGDDEWSDTIRREVNDAWEDAANVTVTLNKDSDWKGAFNKLPLAVPNSLDNVEGEDSAVEYRVVEAEVNGAVPQEDKVNITGGKAEGSGTYVYKIENTVAEGNLKVTKTVESSVDADMGKEFEFEVALGNTSINKAFGDTQFTDGKTTFKLKGGEEKLIEGLPAGISYTVSEKNGDGFDVVAQGVTGEIESGQTKTAAFTNKRQSGSLKVEKEVVSPAPADASKKFTFTITLSDTTLNGKFGNVQFNGGVGTVELASGQSETITGLPLGITYTVTEADAPGFMREGEVTEATEASVRTIALGEKTVHVKNTRETGELEVTKTVTSSVATDLTKDFRFKVTITNDNTFAGTFGGVEFARGEGTFTLKNGETKSITGLPAGLTYKVEEETASGFITTKTGDTGTIAKDKKSTAAFTNVKSGGLVVSKTVNSTLPSDANKQFSFTVTLKKDNKQADITGTYGQMEFTNGKAEFTLKGGDTKSATGLPEGIEYTVEETADNDFTTTHTGQTSGTLAGSANVAFTNTRKTGNLDVKKIVSSDVADDATKKEFSFKVTLGEAVTGTFGGMSFTNGVATFTLKHNQEKSATGLPLGVHYEVEEIMGDGFEYDVVKEGDTGNIATTLSTATFTNTRKTGGLKLHKTVSSDAAADKTKEFKFEIELGDTTITKKYSDTQFTAGKATVKLKDGEEKLIEGLPAGISYTVTEKNDEGFDVVTEGQTTSAIAANDTKEVAFTNIRKTGGFSVKKSVTSSTASDKTKDFTFEVTLSDTTINTDAAANKTYGDMTFKDGKATFTLKDNETKTASNLPLGIKYTIAEQADGDFTTTHTGNVTDQEITGTAQNVVFTNTKKEGGLVVSKSVTSPFASDKTAKYEITVTLTDDSVNGTYGNMAFTDGIATLQLADGEYATATGLPEGMRYTVAEKDKYNKDFDVTYVGETTDNIVKDGTKTVAVANTRKSGKLKVTKAVESDAAADKEAGYTFRVTLNPALSGTFDGTAFDNGVTTFALKDGKSKEITGLPVGVSYTVEEETTAGFTVVKTGDTGRIATEEKTAAFTNKRKTGELEVTKVVSSAKSSDKSAKYPIKVTLSDTTINTTADKTYGGMTFKNGVAEFELGDQESLKATNLPVGLTYTVEEKLAEGQDDYVVTYSGKTGTIATTPSDATVTNTRTTGDLEVSKSLLSDAADDEGKTFEFTITLDDTTISGKFGQITFTNGVAVVNIAGNTSLTATGLPTDVKYTVTETENGNYVQGKTTAGEGTISNVKSVEQFTNTRKTGQFDVKKVVESSTASDKEADFSFTATLSDKSITGQYGDMTFTNGVASFTLHDGQTVSAKNLPVGITYEVVETTADGFVTTKSGDTDEISATEERHAVFTNTKSEGGLVVSKSVDSAVGADHTKDYNFTVTLGDNTVNGTYGDMTFENGVATFTLKDTEKKSATGLANGMSYTVTEANYDDFTTTYVGKTAGREDVTSNEGTIETNATKAVEVTNTRAKGNLKVSKELVSNKTSDADKTFTFTVTLKNAEGKADESINGTFNGVAFEKGVGVVTLKGGENKVIEGLPANVAYEVTENETGDANVVLASKTDESGTIPANTEVEAHFKNERKTGELKVKKVVANGASSDASVQFTFEVQLDDEGVNGEIDGQTFTNGHTSFTLTGGQDKTITGLPATVGYTVTETGVSENDFVATWTGNTSGTIEAGKTAEVTCTNERQYGSLNLQKIVQVDGEATTGTAADGTYRFRITGPNGYKLEPTIAVRNGKSETLKVGGLVAGEYTIQELTDGLASNMHLMGEQSRKVTVAANNETSVPTVPFINNLTTTNAHLEASKLFDSWDNVTWPEGAVNGFEFRLAAVGDAPMPAGLLHGVQVKAATKATPKAVFDDITYTEPGKYRYTITEVVPTGANENGVYRGITYDKTAHGATVEVAPNGQGDLVATVTYDDGKALSVSNTYDATGAIELKGAKVLTGRKLTNDDKWSFTISSDEQGVPMPANTTVTNDGANISFGEIAFGLEHVREQPYVYKITESGQVDGVLNDAQTTKTVAVRVADGGDGTLRVTADEQDGKYFSFTNTHEVTETLEAIKGIEGRVWKQQDGTLSEDYTFRIEATGVTNDEVAASEAKLTSSNVAQTATTKGAEHKASFGTFRFTEADAGKIYTYRVVEEHEGAVWDASRNAFVKDGVAYSNVQYDVTFTVFTDDAGQLQVTKQIKRGEQTENDIKFVNEYEAKPTEAQVTAKKNLIGRQATTDNEFTFELWFENSNGVRSLAQTKTTTRAAGDAYDATTNTDTLSVVFDPIKCAVGGERPGDANTEKYIIKEKIPEGAQKQKDANGVEHWVKDGVTYDDTEQVVQIATTDDQNGQLLAEVKYQNQTEPVFTNHYFGAVANVSFNKAYYGKDTNVAFGFTMKAMADDTYKTVREGGAVNYDAAFVDDGQALNAKAKNGTFVNGVATVSMPAITYHAPGTYYYLITEDAPGQDSKITPDAAAIRVKVEVSNDAKATVTYALDDGENVTPITTDADRTLYNNANVSMAFRSAALRAMADATSFTNFEPAVSKVLKNGYLKGGEFQFAIYEGDKAEGDALKTVSNDANGKVSFGDFTYGPADAGKTFTYTIVELAGTDETVVYDNEPIKLTVKVTKNADGAIVAEGTYEDATDNGTYVVTDNPTFVNEYDTIAIHAIKRSREEPYDPLPGAHYGLWMVNPGGEDVYMGLGRNQLEVEGSELVSSDNGDLYYDIPLLEGVAYYFLEEWPPPAGHLVDPYPTDYFTLVHDKENGKFRLVYEADADFSKYCPGVTR